MNLRFKAEDVTYLDAIDGEIVQISFNEKKDDDRFNSKTKYLIFSVSYEFEPIEPSIEWFDGNECDGGSEVTKYSFTKNSLKVWLENGLSFDVSYLIDDDIYTKIGTFFNNVMKHQQNA